MLQCLSKIIFVLATYPVTRQWPTPRIELIDNARHSLARTFRAAHWLMASAQRMQLHVRHQEILESMSEIFVGHC